MWPAQELHAENGEIGWLGPALGFSLGFGPKLNKRIEKCFPFLGVFIKQSGFEFQK
jgi:hypothetical protein